MPITRVNELQALPGQGDVLWKHLQALVKKTSASPGCHSCQLLRGVDDAERLVVIEVWEDGEAHKAALKTFPREVFTETLRLVASPPVGRNYQE